MADISKISPDDGSTILSIKDSNAVHWGDQSKGYVGKNLAYEVLYGYALFGAGTGTEFAIGGNNNGCVAIAHVKKNTDYVFSKATGNRCRVVGFSQKPQIDVTDTNGHQFIEDNTKLTLSFNSGNYEWVVCACNSTDAYVGDMDAMVRLASIPDSTYEPYLTPNTDLLPLTQWDNSSSYRSNNLLPIYHNSTIHAVVGNSEYPFVVDANGYMSCNVSDFRDENNRYANAQVFARLKSGDYIFISERGTTPSGTNHTFKVVNESNTVLAQIDNQSTNKESISFTLVADTNIALFAKVRDGSFRFSIIPKSFDGCAYMEHIPTNEELKLRTLDLSRITLSKDISFSTKNSDIQVNCDMAYINLVFTLNEAISAYTTFMTIPIKVFSGEDSRRIYFLGITDNAIYKMDMVNKGNSGILVESRENLPSGISLRISTSMPLTDVKYLL